MNFYNEIFINNDGKPFLYWNNDDDWSIINQEEYNKAIVIHHPSFDILQCREISKINKFNEDRTLLLSLDPIVPYKCSFRLDGFYIVEVSNMILLRQKSLYPHYTSTYVWVLGNNKIGNFYNNVVYLPTEMRVFAEIVCEAKKYKNAEELCEYIIQTFPKSNLI